MGVVVLRQELTELVVSLRHDNEDLTTRHLQTLSQWKEVATARELVSISLTQSYQLNLHVVSCDV